MIVCSGCGGDSTVRDSRPINRTVRRRRRCKSCGHKWTTFEFSRDAITAMRAAISLLRMAQEQQAALKDLAQLIAPLEDLEESPP